MDCEQATRLLSEGQDRPLRAGERARLRAHTLVCSGCRAFGRQLLFLRQALRGFARGEHESGPPPDEGPGQPPPGGAG